MVNHWYRYPRLYAQRHPETRIKIFTYDSLIESLADALADTYEFAGVKVTDEIRAALAEKERQARSICRTPC